VSGSASPPRYGWPDGAGPPGRDPHYGAVRGSAARHMCAGVYLDQGFRDFLIKKVYCDRNRRVAPSYGFSLVPVLLHAWKAWYLQLIQELLVAGIFVAGVAWAPPGAVLAAGILVLCYAGGKLARLAKDTIAYLRGKRLPEELRRLKVRRNILVPVAVAALVACAVAIGVGLGSQASSGRVGQPWYQLGVLGAAVAILVCVAGVVMAVAAARQLQLNHLRARAVAPGRGHRRRVSVIRVQEQHPFTVYSRHLPFIGSGIQVRRWSFAQRLVHPTALPGESTQEYTALPFSAVELIGYLRLRIGELNEDHDPQARLGGLWIRDQVLLDGTHATRYREALRSDCGGRAMDEAITSLITYSSAEARHYLTCQVESWDGEVVTSVFVHVSLQARTLHLEFTTCALLPTRRRYHVVDEVGETGSLAVARAAVKSLRQLTGVIAVPRHLAQVPALMWAAGQAQHDGTAVDRRGVNIGAVVSAREEATGGETHFQFNDIFQHAQIIERRLIAGVEDFLKDHNIDTSEFNDRVSAILNNGIFNTGPGTVNVSDSAVGPNASAGGPPAPPKPA
jgi:hypothetical protein